MDFLLPSAATSAAVPDSSIPSAREKFAVADKSLSYSAGVDVGLVRWEGQVLLKRSHLPVAERQHSGVRTMVDQSRALVQGGAGVSDRYSDGAGS